MRAELEIVTLFQPDHCRRHYEEPVADHCQVCDGPFCQRCLVWAFGPKKPPYCVGCALKVAGVRSDAGGRAVPKRLRQKREKVEPVATTDKPRRGLFKRKAAEPEPVEPSTWPATEGRVPSMAELGVRPPTDPGVA